MYHLSSLVFISLINSYCVFADICPNSAYCRLTEWHAWNCTGCVSGTFPAVRERGVCCSSPYLDVCLIGCKLNKTDVEQTGDCHVLCKTPPYSPLLTTASMVVEISATGKTGKSTGKIVGISSVNTNRVTVANRQQNSSISPETTVRPSNVPAFRGSEQSTPSIVSLNFSLQKGVLGERNETFSTTQSIESEESVCLGHCKRAKDFENCMTDCLSIPYSNLLCKILWISLFVLGFVIGGMIMATLLACLKRRKQKKRKVLPIKHASRHHGFRQNTSNLTVNDKLPNRDYCYSFTRPKNISITDTTSTSTTLPDTSRVRAQLDDVC